MSRPQGVITFAVDEAKKRRVATYTGRIDDDTILSAYANLVKQADFDPSLDDLADMREVTSMDVSATALRQIMGMFAPVDQLAIPTRLALVAASDLVFGMSRMYEMLRGDDVPEEIRVFRSHDEAITWLDAGRAG